MTNKTPDDRHRRRLVRQFADEAFGIGESPPPELTHDELLAMFHSWARQQAADPGFWRLLQAAVDESEAVMTADPSLTVVWRLSPGGRIERSWRQRGQLAPERIGDLN